VAADTAAWSAHTATCTPTDLVPERVEASAERAAPPVAALQEAAHAFLRHVGALHEHDIQECAEALPQIMAASQLCALLAQAEPTSIPWVHPEGRLRCTVRRGLGHALARMRWTVREEESSLFGAASTRHLLCGGFVHTDSSLCGKWSSRLKASIGPASTCGCHRSGQSLWLPSLGTVRPRPSGARSRSSTSRPPISLPSRGSPSAPTGLFTTPIPRSSGTTPASHHSPLWLPGRRASCHHERRHSLPLIQKAPADYQYQSMLRPCRALVSTACASGLMPVLDTRSCTRARLRAISARTGNTACAENQPQQKHLH